jgi:hypothetical protein
MCHTRDEALSAATKCAGDWWRLEIQKVEVRVRTRRERLKASFSLIKCELHRHAHEMLFDITADKLTDLAIFAFLAFIKTQLGDF